MDVGNSTGGACAGKTWQVFGKIRKNCEMCRCGKKIARLQSGWRVARMQEAGMSAKGLKRRKKEREISGIIGEPPSYRASHQHLRHQVVLSQRKGWRQ